MISTFTSYQVVSRNMDRSISTVKAQPQVAREIEYYLNNIGKMKTIEDFAGNRRLLNFAMKAHGLSDMAYAKALMVKVLKEGRDDKDSFANRLADRRYLEFAETFDFARHGALAMSFTKAQQGVVDKYLRLTLEENAGAENEGVRLSLYFQRKAPKLTNVAEILGDKALATVVRTALGMPVSTALLDLDRQISMLEARVDVKEFSDSNKLSKFIKRFTALWDVENGVQTQSSAVGLLFDRTAASDVSPNLMLSIQNLKR